ncbi:NucA/NucB deoxyribonuclease domain-containing protein [Streptomyces luteireticuli]|uniref:Deoxyribonuclease NucA/NucB domain-containing protein n=1 Tax=Streptomyces luteireticuli TaxID=173858 RepID=A0ABN0YWB9_9ACTN
MESAHLARRIARALAAATATALLLPASAATAADPNNDELRAEVYVVPTGTPAPSVDELRDGSGTARLEKAAKAAAGPMTALETVGPAAEYAPKTNTPSATPAFSAPTATPAAAARLTYPAPARSMSLDECKLNLKGGAPFYVKSRFAACTGKGIGVTFWKDRKPVGTSFLNFYIRGSVVKDTDRQIRFGYDVADFKVTGKPPTSGQMFRINYQMTKIWPESTKVKNGGNMPRGRSFDDLRRMKPAHFLHTAYVDAGHGSGSADLVQAVYAPTIKVELPKPYIGGGTSQFPLLAPKWDAAKHLKNGKGKGNPALRGAASFSYIPTLHYSTKAGAPEKGVAEHLKKAFTDPKATKPVNAKKDIPGNDLRRPLHRLLDGDRKKENRKISIPQCVRYWGKNYTQGGKFECDEFPFASTYEGAAQPKYDRKAMKDNFSVMPVVAKENGDAGTLLLSFYAQYRILDGADDAFIVKID